MSFLIVGEIDYETLYSHCVTVIKMYPWLKSELERSFTQKLTHEILKPDDAQSVMVCRHRRSATDKLLKYVLKSKTIYLRPFLRMLKDESDSKEELKEELNRNKKVTEKEIQGNFMLVADLYDFSSV